MSCTYTYARTYIYMASFHLLPRYHGMEASPGTDPPSSLSPLYQTRQTLLPHISSPWLTQARQMQALIVAARTRRRCRARLEVHLPVIGIRRHLAGDKVEFCTRGQTRVLPSDLPPRSSRGYLNPHAETDARRNWKGGEKHSRLP